MHKTPELYRGLAHSINGARTANEIADAAQLNWTVVKRDMFFYDGRMIQKCPDEKAVVRSDNRQQIASVSNSFQLHQNVDIIRPIAEAAQTVGIELTHGGSFDGGASIYLHGSIKDKTFNALEGHGTYAEKNKAREDAGYKVGDNVGLNFRLTGGHRPGTPSTIEGDALRLTCLNGMTMMRALGRLRWDHRQKLTDQILDEIRGYVDTCIAQFTKLAKQAQAMAKKKITDLEAKAFFAALVQPSLLNAAVNGQKISQDELHQVAGKSILDRLTASNQDVFETVLIESEPKDKPGRKLNQLMEVLDSQPGANLAKGTVWNAYNAVTYLVDHVTGRSLESGVESAIYGEGARLKASALDMAVAMTEGKMQLAAIA